MAKKKAPVERFTKKALLLSERFYREKGLLGVLLEDGKAYSINEVENLIDTYKKGQVK